MLLANMRYITACSASPSIKEPTISVNSTLYGPDVKE